MDSGEREGSCARIKRSVIERGKKKIHFFTSCNLIKKQNNMSAPPPLCPQGEWNGRDVRGRGQVKHVKVVEHICSVGASKYKEAEIQKDGDVRSTGAWWNTGGGTGLPLHGHCDEQSCVTEGQQSKGGRGCSPRFRSDSSFTYSLPVCPPKLNKNPPTVLDCKGGR